MPIALAMPNEGTGCNIAPCPRPQAPGSGRDTALQVKRLGYGGHAWKRAEVGQDMTAARSRDPAKYAAGRFKARLLGSVSFLIVDPPGYRWSGLMDKRKSEWHVQTVNNTSTVSYCGRSNVWEFARLIAKGQAHRMIRVFSIAGWRGEERRVDESTSLARPQACA